jgi:hypothetical protein
VKVLGRFDKVDKVAPVTHTELLRDAIDNRRDDAEYHAALAELGRIASKGGFLVKGEHKGVPFIGVYREKETL